MASKPARVSVRKSNVRGRVGIFAARASATRSALCPSGKAARSSAGNVLLVKIDDSDKAPVGLAELTAVARHMQLARRPLIGGWLVTSGFWLRRRGPRAWDGHEAPSPVVLISLWCCVF
jgi:hypothetical protein